MTRILVIYHSIKGPVAQVAQEIAIGAREVAGTEAVVKSVQEVTDDDVLSADGIAFGCMKFYGSLTPEMTSLFERLYPLHEKLKYKVGAAFSGSPSQYGGQEQVMELLIFSMINTCNMIAVGGEVRDMGFIGGYIASQPMDEVAKRVNRGVGRRLALVARRLQNGAAGEDD